MLVRTTSGMHHWDMKRHVLALAEAADYRNYFRLFMLRNTEIFCIGLGVAVAELGYGLELPLRQLLVTLALICLLNAFTWLRLRTGHAYGSNEIFVQMLLDVAGLTAVFYYTGGASNPFIWFYLLPLMIAATILPRIHTWIMAIVTVLCYTALFQVKTPGMDPHALHHVEGFQMHVLGMWLGFVMSASFVAVIIVGMAQSLRERDQRLSEAREQALRNERLVALGTLAAGTAHELGTPLGTMAILVDEMQQEHTQPEQRSRLEVLRRQIERCKQALSSLSVAAGAERAESGHLMQVGDWLRSAIEEWQTHRPAARLETIYPEHYSSGMILAERTLNQAIVNVLNNAADASPDSIRLHADCSDTELVLEISDRGPGLSMDIHHRLGKQPVTTKRDGLGVGLYLAHATIERLGGKITISNREGGGTVLTITLPLLTRPGGQGHADT